jgi:hypothetical protein
MLIYEEVTVIDKVREWATKYDKKHVICCVETGEVVETTGDIRAFKWWIRQVAPFIAIEKVLFYSKDKNAVDYLRNYYMKCRNYNMKKRGICR